MPRNKKHPLFVANTLSLRAPQWFIDKITERTLRGDIDKSEFVIEVMLGATKWKAPVIGENRKVFDGETGDEIDGVSRFDTVNKKEVLIMDCSDCDGVGIHEENGEGYSCPSCFGTGKKLVPFSDIEK